MYSYLLVSSLKIYRTLPSQKIPARLNLGLANAPTFTSNFFALERENQHLKAQNAKVQNENAQLSAELHNFRISQLETLDPTAPTTPPEVILSDEAARKRLERVCKKNSQGNLVLGILWSRVFFHLWPQNLLWPFWDRNWFTNKLIDFFWAVYLEDITYNVYNP